MKRIVLILMLIVPACLYAQKPVKPNLNKALSLMQEGKLAEAKDMIDAATTYEKTMGDGKTWYYRGLIYSSLDTTSNEAFKALSPNPLNVAIESFKKADQMASADKEYFIVDPNNLAGAADNTKPAQLERLANYYLNKAINLVQQDEPDYAASLVQLEKTKFVFENAMTEYRNDTLTYFVIAIAAQNAEKPEEAIAAAKEYYKRKGKGKEPYIIMYQIYTNKDDKEKALEVVREAKAALPNELDFPLMEIELLIKLDRASEAKGGLEKAIVSDPGNKTLHFFLGYVNIGENDLVTARKNFEDAIRIDPQYFEAQLYLAKVIGEDAKKIKRQINNLGISAADKKKKMELDGQYVEKLKVALPHWEKAEKLNGSDKEVLEELYSIYQDLGMQAQVDRIDKKLTQLEKK